jgi:hypothetical protein
MPDIPDATTSDVYGYPVAGLAAVFFFCEDLSIDSNFLLEESGTPRFASNVVLRIDSF